MALPAARGPSRRQLALGVMLCAILLPLAQASLAALSAGGIALVLACRRPAVYLAIAGLGALCATGGLDPAQARARGSLVGVLAGSGGAVVAILIAAVVFVMNLHNAAGSPLHPAAQSATPPLMAAVPGPPIPIPLVMLLFAPFFVAEILLGVGLAALGGMLGGWLRASRTWHGAPAGARAGGVTVAVVSVAALLAFLVVVVGIVFLTGAFSSINAAPAP